MKGIAGLCHTVDREWHQRALVAEKKFRSTILPQVAMFPHLQKLPTPVQNLLADQIKLANAAMNSLDAPKELNDVAECDCEFYRKYQLPCSHIFVQHQLFGTLKEEDFERWALMWEESGFELYEGTTSEVSSINSTKSSLCVLIFFSVHY